MIDIQDPQKSIACSRFLPLLKGVARACGLDGSLTIRIGTDEESHELNRRHRHKNKPTDVLSFPEEILPGMRHPYHGDILIALGVASRQAREAGIPLEEELLTLMVHGMLHLAGWDHETDKGEMMDFQKRIMAGLTVPLPRNHRRPDRASQSSRTGV